MPRTFAYARVSTMEQNVENQLKEIYTAGFIIESYRIITETISGSMPIARRKGFKLCYIKNFARFDEDRNVLFERYSSYVNRHDI